jgi:acyl-CoA-binding protein
LAAELYIASAAKNALYICHIKQMLTCYALVRQCNRGADITHKINSLALTKRLQALSWARLKPPQKRLNDSVLLP